MFFTENSALKCANARHLSACTLAHSGFDPFSVTMVKRPNKRDSNELEQEYEERRQYIRENAPLMELETLAKGFFTKFNANSKSAAHDSLHASLRATGFEQLAKETKVWCVRVCQRLRTLDSSR